jgi:hypothetical protein
MARSSTMKRAWANARRAGRSKLSSRDFNAARYRGSKSRRRTYRRRRTTGGGGKSAEALIKQRQKLDEMVGKTPEQIKQYQINENIQRRKEAIDKQLFNKYVKQQAQSERSEKLQADKQKSAAAGADYWSRHKDVIITKYLPAGIRGIAGGGIIGGVIPKTGISSG